jgi:outer membrane receptor protein involved in Fe transport
LLPGVRFEATKTEFDTFLVQGSTASNQPLPGTVRIKPTRDYNNFFPGLHARYDFTRDLLVRASFTESLARPTFSQLNPRENRNVTDDAVDNDSISRGRLDLKPTTARNYDVSIERYLGRLGYVSAGVFYKDYKNNVYRFVQTELVNNIPTRVTEPRNARGGKLLGLELAADLSHEGRRSAVPDGSIELPSWTRTDLAARWVQATAYGGTQTWRLGIDNLFDRRAWKEAPTQFGHIYLYPLAPRTLRLSVTAAL